MHFFGVWGTRGYDFFGVWRPGGTTFLVRHGSRACWGSRFSALSDRGFEVFGALGGEVVLGVRGFHRSTPGGSRFSALSDRGFEIFGALGGVVVLGVRVFHLSTPGG